MHKSRSMSLSTGWFRVPLGVQVGLVAALFIAALAALWTTGASVLASERRRSEAKSLLDRAGRDLAVRGQVSMARAGEFPDFPEESSRETLDRDLSLQARAALMSYKDIEGGYLVLRFKSFLGTT